MYRKYLAQQFVKLDEAAPTVILSGAKNLSFG
jgi:hypothetical protein